MGMTYDQYWDGPPFLAVQYRKAFRLKRELDNESAWLHGLYVYDAVASVLSSAFGKKGETKHKYMEKPIDLFPLTEAEKKKREQEEYAKMQTALEAMRKEQQRRKRNKVMIDG